MEILTNLRKTLIEVSSWFAGLLNDADGIALAIAILTPALLIFGRREIRYRRLIALRNLASSYPALAEKGLNPQRYADEINPSFEFVKDKYVAEVRSVKAAGAKAAEWPPLNQIENAIRAARAFGSIWEVRLFLAGSGLMIITYYGMINLQHLLSSGISIPSTAINGDNCPPETAFKQTQLIGTLTFAGAFVAALRVFMRGLAVFDLSAYIFLRQTAAIFSSVIITIFLYKAFPDPIKPIEALLTGASGGSARCDVPWVWLALAPVLGLIPFSAIKFIMIRLQSVINWVKSDDDRFVRQTRVITVDVIDGVDYDTRFRLEECGIYDVQNLATYNPSAPYRVTVSIVPNRGLGRSGATLPYDRPGEILVPASLQHPDDL